MPGSIQEITLLKKLGEIFSNCFSHSVPPNPHELMDVCSQLTGVNADLRFDKNADIKILRFLPYPIRLVGLVLLAGDEECFPIVSLLLKKSAIIEIAELNLLLTNIDANKLTEKDITEFLDKFDKSKINDVVDGDGNTVLHQIAGNDNLRDSLLNFILGCGINVNAVNNQAKTAANIALEKRNYTFFARLLHHGLIVDDNLLYLVRSQYANDGAIIDAAFQAISSELTHDTTQVDSDRFKSVVAVFCQQNNLTRIADMFAVTKSQKPLTMSFFSRAGVSEFLTRNAISYNQESYPSYLDIEEELYQSASNQAAFDQASIIGDNVYKKAYLAVPFRSEPVENSAKMSVVNTCASFYTSGTSRKSINIYIDMIKDSMRGLDSSFVKLIFPTNIYNMGRVVNQMATDTQLTSNSRGYCYIISATIRDNHIFATLSIINTLTRKVHCHIVVNSWDSQEYVHGADIRINHGNVGKGSPVLNGSLHVQVNQGDGNCGLYTIKICKALHEILVDNNGLQELLETMDVNDHSIWEQVRGRFSGLLKTSLPEFYKRDESGDIVSRPYDELKAFHMNLRWETGNRYLRRKCEKYKARIAQEHDAWDNIKRVLPVVSSKR